MSSRRLSVGCEFTYEAAVRTPAIFQVQPGPSCGFTVTSEAWSSTPQMRLRSYADLYGNPCTRVVLPAGRSTFRYAADVDVPDAPEDADEFAREVAPDDLPDDTLIYTLPSRYCLPDMLGDEAWARFGSSSARLSAGAGDLRSRQRPPDLPLRQLAAWSTAVDVNASGYGVCRDFTHLAISFCRALNIPARYVFGYLPDMDVPVDPAPMDFAAWMEVWLGDRWWTFDPRNNTRRKGRILIGRGRDASDVAMVTTFGGPQLHSMTVHAAEVLP